MGRPSEFSDEIQVQIDPMHAELSCQICGLRGQIRKTKGVSFLSLGPFRSRLNSMFHFNGLICKMDWWDDLWLFLFPLHEATKWNQCCNFLHAHEVNNSFGQFCHLSFRSFIIDYFITNFSLIKSEFTVSLLFKIYIF